MKSENSSLHLTPSVEKLLFVGGGVLIFVLALTLGFYPLQNSNTTMQTQNAQLQQKLASYQQMDSNKDQNKTSTKKMNKQIDQTMESYLSTIHEEDQTLLSSVLQAQTGAQISALTYSPQLLITTTVDPSTGETTVSETDEATLKEEQAQASTESSSQTSSSDSSSSDTSSSDTSSQDSASSDTSSADQTAAASSTQTTNTYQLYTKPLELEFTCGYQSLKQLINVLQTMRYKTNVESLSVSFDSSTGLLTGTMTINNFSIKDSPTGELTYNVVSECGTSNLFGTAN